MILVIGGQKLASASYVRSLSNKDAHFSYEQDLEIFSESTGDKGKAFIFSGSEVATVYSAELWLEVHSIHI